MKRPFYKQLIFLIPCFLILANISCKKDIDKIVKEQEKNNIFYPRIFDNYAVFAYPNTNKTIPQGGTVNYNGFLYSPAGKVAISWKVDGTEVSKDTSYLFTGTNTGVYEVRLTVSYQADSTERVSLVTVE